MNHRPPSYLSCASLARELDVSESTVQEMLRRKVLPPPVRFSSGCVRWSWSEVQLALGSIATAGRSGESEDDPFLKGVRNVTTPAQQ